MEESLMLLNFQHKTAIGDREGVGAEAALKSPDGVRREEARRRGGVLGRQALLQCEDWEAHGQSYLGTSCVRDSGVVLRFPSNGRSWVTSVADSMDGSLQRVRPAT